jgi:hypothetical protein
MRKVKSTGVAGGHHAYVLSSLHYAVVFKRHMFFYVLSGVGRNNNIREIDGKTVSLCHGE